MRRRTFLELVVASSVSTMVNTKKHNSDDGDIKTSQSILQKKNSFGDLKDYHIYL